MYVIGVLPVVPKVEAVKRLLTFVVPEMLTCATGARPKTIPVAALVAVEDPPLFVAVALTLR